MSTPEITSLLNENRHFPPPAGFREQAHIASMDEYNRLRKQALEDPEAFWSEAASQLHWFKKWDRVLDWNVPDAKWFVGGKTNIAYNCLDRHLDQSGHKTAILWEGEPGDKRSISFRELHEQVSKFSNVLLSLGVQAGDRVAIYMPMIPELAIAMLGCARIGAVHSVVFGGFSPVALRDRILDAQAKIVVTADGGYRRGKIVPLKDNIDASLEGVDCVQNVIVYNRTKHDINMQSGRDLVWQELMDQASADCPAAELDSEHPLYILYTSGTTGKPKGILHTTGGYMVGTQLTSKWVFDLKPNDIYWCTADCGWVTGHSYIVYGILANGCTTLMYEGAPTYPEPNRLWDIVERYKVSIFYTAPTAIRAFIKCGDQWPKKHDLKSLRLLGTVGEPINPEAWMWYHEVIGNENCPIVDTWWQTETGAIMISPLPGITLTKPGSATLPLPWVDADIVDENGKSITDQNGGYLVVRKPWPSMLRTIYGDHRRFQDVYWSRFDGLYFAGDSAHRDKDGYFWIMGRVDDVINVSGHRLGTMEVESALVSHEGVAEAAVVGMPHEIKGQGICAFVIPKEQPKDQETFRKTLTAHVAKEIGAIAKPDIIVVTEALPKTRSGKIMRRLLKDLAAGRETSGDTTTLEDPTIIENLKQARGIR